MNKIYYWKLLYITQNWYCGRFIQRSENLVCNGNDNIDNHNQPQFEHEWDSVCIMCAHLCSTSAFHQLNFWFQCKHVTNGQYSYFPFCYLNSLLFSSFRTWFVYIFFFWYGKQEKIMCGPHKSKKIAAMLVFLILIECICCRIFRAS